ncbi:MAG: hypothetical protein ACOWWH_03680 [Eubacteriaceae bacterium]
MRIDKIYTHYKENISNKNQKDVVPFEDAENDITPVIKNKSSLSVEQVQINTFKGKIISIIPIEQIQDVSNNSLIKLVEIIAQERKILYPKLISIFENNNIELLLSDDSILTIKDIKGLTDLTNIKPLLEQKIININEDNPIPHIIDIKISSGSNNEESENNIMSIYKNLLLNNNNPNNDEKTNNIKTLICNLLKIQEDTPIVYNLKFPSNEEQNIEFNQTLLNKALTMIKENKINNSNKELNVKVINSFDSNLLYNGKPINKAHNILDIMLNRRINNIEEGSNYQSINSLVLESIISENETNTLLIDIPNIGFLFLDEKIIKRIMYNMPYITAIYSSQLYQKLINYFRDDSKINNRVMIIIFIIILLGYILYLFNR